MRVVALARVRDVSKAQILPGVRCCPDAPPHGLALCQDAGDKRGERETREEEGEEEEEEGFLTVNKE